MKIEESTFNYDGNEIKFKFRPAKQDRRHLIVMFTGFAAEYDFQGASSEGCRSAILWIKDEFQGQNCYYILKNKLNSPEVLVINLIEHILKELDLEKNQCTLLGF